MKDPGAYVGPTRTNTRRSLMYNVRGAAAGTKGSGGRLQKVKPDAQPCGLLPSDKMEER